MSQVPQSASRFSIASPLAGGALHAVGSGLFHTLLPLRLVQTGHSADAVGLVIMAEGAGFLVGCIASIRLVRSVGEVRAYAAFSASSAVLILALGGSPSLAAIMAIQSVIGFANAGQAVIIESWLNAMVPNEGRGKALTLYVLVIGLFYGLGQLLGREVDPAGHEMLMITAAFYALALVPVTAIWVGEPQLHAPVGIHVFRAFRTSPLGTLACLLTGLVSATFSSIGPLYGLGLGFSQDRIVILMAAVQLGALFLQFPLGYLSDRLDRRAMMLWLAVALVAVCGAFLFVTGETHFWLLIVLFSVFGGIAEIFYPLGVAHANDRAKPSEFVVLSSNLLLIWALGSTFGPMVAAAGVERLGPASFFWYAIGLTVLFAGVAIWRRASEPEVVTRDEFVAYPQTSPAVYEWAQKDDGSASSANQPSERGDKTP
ncbi:MFS transporter [Rhizobiaceae bacterium n13]|uniref:MFS transporter n=1 Tax=Ferirhizobium litorale TaxID=2927786 RepID=A0AAE3U0Z4_9HYPH|nr:MFS transporter [Fererhizobium litorale]MDI7862128.1 MFS transporter [Fererhizobium litorale]MDI7922599.1 MFS transporter [Fererhizobium litorale]